jgi:hypothetical protein
MNKKTRILILFILSGLTKSIGQNLNVDYVARWLKACNETYEPSLVSVYFIDGEYERFDNSAEANSRLHSIKIAHISYITHFPYLSCNYEPGKGPLFIRTKSKRNSTEIKELIEFANSLIEDKPRVLVLNNEIQQNISFSEIVNKLGINTIYDIGISSEPVPKDIYGDHSENGIIKV